MKIAFLTRFDLSKESGVLKKIIGQIEVWASDGNEVALFAQTHSDELWEGLDHIQVHFTESEMSPKNSGLKKITERFNSMNRLAKMLDQWNPDVVFYRYTTYYPSISKLMDKHPFVLEINTDDRAEYRLKFGRLKNLYHSIFRKIMLKKAKGMVFVTFDLEKMFSEFDAKKLVCANSINLEFFEEIAAPNNQRPRFVFIGTPNRAWHGVDKIVELATLMPDYDFDLIGPSVEDFNEPLPQNIIVNGYLKRKEYLEIVRKADFAIGSLGFHRIPLKEACPLKVREYLAYGIPTILPYLDTDFIEKDHPLLLKLDSSEDTIQKNHKVIDQWAKNSVGKRIYREDVSHIDAAEKEREKLEFLRIVVNL